MCLAATFFVEVEGILLLEDEFDLKNVVYVNALHLLGVVIVLISTSPPQIEDFLRFRLHQIGARYHYLLFSRCRNPTASLQPKETPNASLFRPGQSLQEYCEDAID
jgi:hypothetical protein